MRLGSGFIEPDVFIELPWQHRFEVMAGELAFGPINHPNGPLKPQPQDIMRRIEDIINIIRQRDAFPSRLVA